MAPLPRATLQRLALAKADDARLLFENGRFSNAYYLYGYAVELGLKACIARHIVAETIPDKVILNRFLTHKIADLVALAGLASVLQERRKDTEFDVRWAVIAEWSEEARYDLTDVVVTTAMHDAIEHAEHGIMAWLKQYW
jgi:HEPN domain-containing protein